MWRSVLEAVVDVLEQDAVERARPARAGGARRAARRTSAATPVCTIIMTRPASRPWPATSPMPIQQPSSTGARRSSRRRPRWPAPSRAAISRPATSKSRGRIDVWMRAAISISCSSRSFSASACARRRSPRPCDPSRRRARAPRRGRALGARVEIARRDRLRARDEPSIGRESGAPEHDATRPRAGSRAPREQDDEPGQRAARVRAPRRSSAAIRYSSAGARLVARHRDASVAYR